MSRGLAPFGHSALGTIQGLANSYGIELLKYENSSEMTEALQQSDIVIAEYDDNMFVENPEVVLAKERYDRRTISITSSEQVINHPQVKLYSDYVVSNREEAFALAKRLSQFSLSQRISDYSREQKDTTDEQFAGVLEREGLDAVVDLLPTELIHRWKKLFGNEYKEVVELSFRPLPKTVRVNTLKSNKEAFLRSARQYGWQYQPLQISPIIFRMPHSFGNELSRMVESGLIYIQELASLLPAFALDPKPGEKILDIAAAPGSKTTQMAAMMNNKGKILANDIHPERFEILKKIIARVGATNIGLHLGDGRELGELHPESFDRVMVDTQCSCEGILRYKAHKFFEWSPFTLHRLVDVQRELIVSGFNALKAGGILVYSTCTFGPEENEAIVDYLLRQFDSAKIESVKFKGVKTRKGMTQWDDLIFDGSLSKTVRIYPQDNNSIGFYIAKIRKIK